MRVYPLLPCHYQSDCLPLIKKTMPTEIYEQAQKALGNPRYATIRRLWGLFDRRNLLGMCGYVNWKGHYWISWTAVDPRRQRDGIGSQLLKKTLNQAKLAGATYIDVETYECPAFFPAVHFYWKHGFRIHRVIRKHLKDGSSMLYMRKVL